jgi:hypothetical protein
MATKQGKKEEQGEKIKVDGTEVNVKTPPPSKVRPVTIAKPARHRFQVNWI